MPCLTKIDTFNPKTGDLNVIIETPQGSRNKYNYDEKARVLALSSLLPAGLVFPFDFGFIPSTKGDDGDPLDVLVLMEVPAPAGSLVPAQVIGVIEAEQTDDGNTERNDRLIAVSTESHRHQNIETLKDLDERTIEEIEHFFMFYNQMHGKKFKPLGHYGAGRALKLIKEGQDRFAEQFEGKKSKEGKKKKGKGKK